jgi:hypothetical protein
VVNFTYGRAGEDDESAVRRGAYGLHLAGVAAVSELLVPAATGWPTATVAVEQGPLEDDADRADESRGTVRFRDAIAYVERDPARAVFRFAGEPRLDAVVHPYLSPVAGLFAHWHGREALHAGGFVHEGGAWGVVADRGGGKSSTLGQLALEGVAIVADDLLVVDGDDALAGPRAIDLREDVAEAFGIGEPLGVLVTRNRWRVGLDQVESATPLYGWVFLEWADELTIREVPASHRLERLGRQRMIRRRPTDPRRFLTLASLPGFVISRPASLEWLPETTRLLRESLHRGSAHA